MTASTSPAITAVVESVVPILPVRDLSASVQYYLTVLGFGVDWQDPGVLASVSLGGRSIFLSEGDQGHPGTWVWFGVDDAAALFEQFAARGARVRMPPTSYPWALEFQLLDPDDNVLRFGSEPREGDPVGPWRDMRGQEWVRGADGSWTRAPHSAPPG